MTLADIMGLAQQETHEMIEACKEIAAILAKLRTTLAAYKLPKAIHIVDELPRNTMGKVQKTVLRENYSL